MTQAYVFDAIRTPRGKGKKDGSLHEVKPISLLTGLLAELHRRHGVRLHRCGHPGAGPACGGRQPGPCSTANRQASLPAAPERNGCGRRVRPPGSSGRRQPAGSPR